MSRKKKKRKARRLSPGDRRLAKENVRLTEFPFDMDSEVGVEAFYNMGYAFHRDGKLHDALVCYQKAVEIKPDYAEAYHNMGIVLKDQGRLSEAMSCFQKALQLKPDLAQAYSNTGNVFRYQGKLSEAVSCFQKAVQLRPDYAGAYYNMGSTFQDQGKSDEAIACYQKALEIKPDYAEAYNNMGTVLQDKGELDEAISCFEKALRLEPDHAEAYNNMGSTFQQQGRSDEAIAWYQKALDTKPDYAGAINNLAHQLRQTCSWQELGDVTAKLDGLTRKALDEATKAPQDPFVSLTTQADLSRNFAIAKSWSSDIARSMSNLKIDCSFGNRRLRRTRIAIGYLSNDFRNHATAHLMLSLFRLHNREEFEIFCYSYGKDDGSDYRKRIERDCDKFIDLQNIGHADAARYIYEDQVDILVDLKGYTTGYRLAICALRPAPVQVSYLGFPGTTGADFFDYIITDRIVTPEDHAPYYSENFVYLPHCYQVNDHTQAISNRDWARKDFGLPEESFVFSSFNRPYKVDPVMFDTWMKILRQVSQGVLWLLRENETAEDNLRHEAEARGVKPERLIFSETLPKDEHLARLRLADLALDTRIVNGHTTTSDALWAGVPIITLQGSHFASRVSASILTAIGLPELITHTLAEYEALAVHLACNPHKLQAIQERLAKNRSTEPLFDTPRFGKNLEKAYKEMWKIYLAGEKPKHIEVVEG